MDYILYTLISTLATLITAGLMVKKTGTFTPGMIILIISIVISQGFYWVVLAEDEDVE